MGKYLDWRDKQLISPDKPMTQEQLAPAYDGNPFADDFKESTWAGYVAAIKRGDGLVEYGYASILLFVGLSDDELKTWRASLIAALSHKMRSKFEQSQRVYLSSVERKEQLAADKANRKRNKKEAQTFDPLAGNASSQMTDKKKPAKPSVKPKSGAKGAMRKYSNEQAKQNTDKLF